MGVGRRQGRVGGDLERKLQATSAKRRKSCGHSQPLPVPRDLQEMSRLRVGHLIAALAISHSGLYERMRKGTIPRPDGHDGRPYWKFGTVRALLEGSSIHAARKQ